MKWKISDKCDKRRHELIEIETHKWPTTKNLGLESQASRLGGQLESEMTSKKMQSISKNKRFMGEKKHVKDSNTDY